MFSSHVDICLLISPAKALEVLQ
uniref:Uncharacterized protein n=1 Tax=Anguilla anguilla TaxID=7936 RepID=A0A0E9W479_ANGAN